MKKMNVLGTSMLVLGLGAGAAYLLMNKNTKKKANKLMNDAMDDASSYFKKNN